MLTDYPVIIFCAAMAFAFGATWVIDRIASKYAPWAAYGTMATYFVVVWNAFHIFDLIVPEAYHSAASRRQHGLVYDGRDEWEVFLDQLPYVLLSMPLLYLATFFGFILLTRNRANHFVMASLAAWLPLAGLSYLLALMTPCKYFSICL